MKKQVPQPIEPTTSKDEKARKFRSFAYALAWLAFLANVGTLIYSAIKDKNPPSKDEYYQ